MREWAAFDADRYLDARKPEWAVVESCGAVQFAWRDGVDVVLVHVDYGDLVRALRPHAALVALPVSAASVASPRRPAGSRPVSSAPHWKPGWAPGVVPGALLSRPGGNVTGISMITVALAPQRLELLHQVIPPPVVIAMLVNPTSPYVRPETEDVIAAARVLERRIHVLTTATPAEIDRPFATLGQQGLGTVLVSSDPFFDSQRERFVALAARYRVPAIYQWDDFATIGGLMSYGTSITNAYREAGVYTSDRRAAAAPGRR